MVVAILFPMSKSRIIILSTLIAMIGCSAANKTIQYNTKSVVNQTFKPDTSINGLALRSEKAIQILFSKEFELLPESERNSFPCAYFLNINSTEYLAIYHYPGDLKDEFSLFEVGYYTKMPDTMINPTNYGFFVTENKIKLGITKRELLKIKGSADTTFQDGEVKIMRYVINDSNSPFLKKYKMPSYFAEYYIEQDKLVKFRFGFDYP